MDALIAVLATRSRRALCRTAHAHTIIQSVTKAGAAQFAFAREMKACVATIAMIGSDIVNINVSG
jgi:hypothetical protein